MIDFGHGIQLGPLKREYLMRMRNLRNNYDIQKWCRQYEPLQEIPHENWFEWQATDPNTKMYAVLDNDSSLLGVAGLTSIDWINSRAEFSLYIDPDCQGRGFGHKALRTLVDHGFKTLNLNCIWGESFENNPALKMFLDLGFKVEGTRRQFYFRKGKYIDATLFSVLRKDWQ